MSKVLGNSFFVNVVNWRVVKDLDLKSKLETYIQFCLYSLIVINLRHFYDESNYSSPKTTETEKSITLSKIR